MELALQFKSQSSYRFKKYLGSGGSAEVLLYSRVIEGLPDQEVVFKVLRDFDKHGLRELVNDGQTLMRLRHPHILTTFGYEKINEKKCGLLLEYVPGSSLSRIIPLIDQIKRIHVAAAIITPICQALAAAHSQGVIHGDLSARNILVSNKGEIKVADFGLATLTISKKPQKMAAFENRGSLDYLAPERLSGGPSSEKSDIFSLGMIACEILSGEKIIKSSDIAGARKQISDFSKACSYEKFVSWRPFFRAALQADPSQRPKAAELLEMIPASDSLSISFRESLAAAVLEATTFGNQTNTVALRRPSGRLRILAGLAALFLFLVTPSIISPEVQAFDLPSFLTLTSRPWGMLYIDQHFQGYTPVVRCPLRSGYHEIVWKSPQGIEVRKSLTDFGTKMASRHIHFRILIPSKRKIPLFF